MLDFGHAGAHGLHGVIAHLTGDSHDRHDEADELPAVLGEAGLVEAQASPLQRTLMGPLVLTRASAPR